jgi:hypothetical protein
MSELLPSLGPKKKVVSGPVRGIEIEFTKKFYCEIFVVFFIKIIIRIEQRNRIRTKNIKKETPKIYSLLSI